jgi:hypothetical protein
MPGTDIIDSEPIPAGVDRLTFYSFAATVRGLIEDDGLTPAGLDHVRGRLRSGEFDAGAPSDVRAGVTLLISDVCEALAGDNRDLRAYYVSVGDIVELGADTWAAFNAGPRPEPPPPPAFVM